jgi:hypothetical protein
MLKFGQNEVEWADIAQFNAIEQDVFEVSLTTTDEVVLVVASFDTAAQAESLKASLESAKAVVNGGGVTIVIIIDDL